MSTITFDCQLEELPKEVMFCKNCVVSNQRPRTKFNEDGICAPCQWAWEKREEELQVLLDRHRSKDGSYDVMVPGSGGAYRDFSNVWETRNGKWYKEYPVT